MIIVLKAGWMSCDKLINIMTEFVIQTNYDG